VEIIAGGKISYIDDEFEYLTQEYRFTLLKQKDKKTYYINAYKGEEVIRLHRLIMLEKGEKIERLLVDHKDRNGLNNIYSNLRIATHSQSSMNRGPRINSSSDYKGVNWHAAQRKWAIRITVKGSTMSLGYTDDENKAARIYNRAAIRFHKEFACLNEVDPLF
jgi:hypothetical protein